MVAVVLLSAALFFKSEPKSICERTPAIVQEIERNVRKSCKEVVPADLVNVKKIYLNSKGLFKLLKSDFEGLSNLEYLAATNNNISEIEADTLHDSKEIDIINLMNNKITNDGLDFLSGLPSLKILNLRGNALSRVTSRTFIKNSALVQLDLSNNSIEVVDVQAFASHSLLRRLDLSQNSLKDFKPETLNACVSLEELNLSFNEGTLQRKFSAADFLFLRSLKFSYF